MAWQCFMVPDQNAPDADKPGAMWKWRHNDQQYISVRLPCGYIFCPMMPSSSDGKPWDVTGSPPQITVKPSINHPNYHGWLTDGVLSDDIEGRHYDASSPCQTR